MASGDITGKVNIPVKKVEYIGSDTDSATTTIDTETNAIEVNVKEGWVTEVAEDGLRFKYVPILNLDGTSLFGSLPNCFYWSNHNILVKYWIGIFPSATCVMQAENGYYRKSINLRNATLDDVYNPDNYNEYVEEEYVTENFFNKHEDVTLEYDDELEESKSLIFETGPDSTETSLGYSGDDDTISLFSFSNIRIDNTDGTGCDININSGNDINLNAWDGCKVNYNGNEVATLQDVGTKLYKHNLVMSIDDEDLSIELIDNSSILITEDNFYSRLRASIKLKAVRVVNHTYYEYFKIDDENTFIGFIQGSATPSDFPPGPLQLITSDTVTGL